jgi:cysteine desulfurase
VSGPIAYLDHNATTPLRPAAAAAMAEVLNLGGNPSSVHRLGRLARRAVEDARHRLAAVIGAEAAEIVFTSGGSEANNLAMAGHRAASIIIAAIEHDSVRAPAHHNGRPCREIAANPDGVVDLSALERALAEAPRPALVALMLANNETGVIQPVAEAMALARAHGAAVHCDGVQALGKMELNFSALGVDSLALSAHKIGGPLGAGVLVVRDRAALKAQILGGGQESGRRAGTENVPGIVGFAAAAEAATSDREGLATVAALRGRIEDGLRRMTPELVVHGAGARRLPNTACIGIPGVAAETAVIALDLAGVAVSSGSACSSGKVRPSHVLTAMGAAPDAAREAIRVSLGWNSRAEDAERLFAAWAERIVPLTRKRSAA